MSRRTLAAGLAWKNGHSWDKICEAVVAGIASALQAVFILFAVGALIGTWAMSGTLVAMVYYAMGVLSPNFFYLTACVVSALVALSIGSSWTVAGIIGVGLMGIAEQMDSRLPITAGAVISGAYFGDKASPLSDTCNLAAASAGSELFEHIRYSLLTSAPALILALVGFGLLGSPGTSTPTPPGRRSPPVRRDTVGVRAGPGRVRLVDRPRTRLCRDHLGRPGGRRVGRTAAARAGGAASGRT